MFKAFEEYSGKFPARFKDSVTSISTAEVASLIEEGSAVLVDVRPPALRKVSHIPGSLAQEDFEARKEEFAGKTIVATW